MKLQVSLDVSVVARQVERIPKDAWSKSARNGGKNKPFSLERFGKCFETSFQFSFKNFASALYNYFYLHEYVNKTRNNAAIVAVSASRSIETCKVAEFS